MGFKTDFGVRVSVRGESLPSPLTLTTETPINRAFQEESEGMRVEKEKKFFRSRRVDKESYLNLELKVKNYSRFAAIYN